MPEKMTPSELQAFDALPKEMKRSPEKITKEELFPKIDSEALAYLGALLYLIDLADNFDLIKLAACYAKTQNKNKAFGTIQRFFPDISAEMGQFVKKGGTLEELESQIKKEKPKRDSLSEGDSENEGDNEDEMSFVEPQAMLKVLFNEDDSGDEKPRPPKQVQYPPASFAERQKILSVLSEEERRSAVTEERLLAEIDSQAANALTRLRALFLSMEDLGVLEEDAELIYNAGCYCMRTNKIAAFELAVSYNQCIAKFISFAAEEGYTEVLERLIDTRKKYGYRYDERSIANAFIEDAKKKDQGKSITSLLKNFSPESDPDGWVLGHLKTAADDMKIHCMGALLNRIPHHVNGGSSKRIVALQRIVEDYIRPKGSVKHLGELFQIIQVPGMPKKDKDKLFAIVGNKPLISLSPYHFLNQSQQRQETRRQREEVNEPPDGGEDEQKEAPLEASGSFNNGGY